jgi:hypothetical protein
LTRYPYSEFELMAEELLMSDSTIKVVLLFFLFAVFLVLFHMCQSIHYFELFFRCSVR